jgi:hypothetical protein
LFLGLLALLNAPVDWFSLGLTRALLRRGLELGGWWPYTLAIVDAALAAMLVWALAIFMVIGVQTFDSLAIAGGGNPVLPLAAIFNGTAVNPAPPNGISSNPTAPEYWWIYALLLSTMIPSLVDLAIGGTSLWRGVPGFPKLLLRFIPPTGNVPKFERSWIAAVMTAQVLLGTVLGTAAQLFLISGTFCPGSASGCSARPTALPPSTCRRGWGSSSGSACSEGRGR